MAIVRLKKITLYGSRSEKQAILEKLQILGSAHLIQLRQTDSSPPVLSTASTIQKQSSDVIQALKYLKQCAIKRHQVLEDNDFDLGHVVQQTLQIQTDLRNLTDQQDFLANRIKEIKPWGNFTLSKENELGGLKCWFYIIPKRLIKSLSKDLIFQVVHQDNIHSYVVVLAEQEPTANSLPVARTHTGKVALSELIQQYHQVKLAIEDKQAERESLTRWITLISQCLTENENQIALKIADTLTLDQQNFFAIQAWVPADRVSDYRHFAETNQLAILIEETTPEDIPPTLLHNQESLAGGEELIKFYQTPAYHAWDPSSIVFFSFALFFAMILSDAGYASIFALILGLKWKSLKHCMKGRRLRFLAAITIILSLIWGILTGSYFGFKPPENSIIQQLNLIDIHNIDSMMRLSIAVGALHIILANLIKIHQLRRKQTALAALGWIAIITAGFILWIAREILQTTGYCLLIFGSSLLLFFSSERRLKSPTDLIVRLLVGIKNLAGITKLFGDILSYMRLFALGLASASLAVTFNQLAEQVQASTSGLGLLSSILILIFGHTLNLMLCLMSGLVHGLRLNFIEFYNWSVSDEGYPFTAFSKKRGR